MKSSFFSIALLLICSTSMAQSSTTVYLKDGSKVKGSVLVNDSTGFVMVISADNSYHYYLKNQVAQIGMDSLKSKRMHSYTLKQKGYLCNIEMGASDILARNGSNLLAFSFNVKNSYIVSPIASFGLGVGTELSAANIETFSVYSSTRLYCIKSDISPFWDIDLGYLIYANKGYYGDLLTTNFFSHGLMFNPSFGIRIAANKKVALTTSVGYKFYYLRTSRYFDNSNETFTEDRDYTHSKGHALTLKAGFQF